MVNMVKSWMRKELQLSNFGLNHPDPDLFSSSQWPCHSGYYFFWRLVTAGYLLVWLVLTGVWDYDWHSTEANRIKWFLYLTNWSFLLLTVSAVWQAGLAAGRFYKDIFAEEIVKRHTETQMKWYMKLSWVLFNISTAAAVVVSFAYWVFIFPYMKQPVHPVDFVTHGTNTVYVLVDLFITGMPVRLLHFVYGMTYCVIYLVFCLVYTLAGGTNALDKDYIYTTFDFRGSPGLSALYGGLLTVVGPIVVWFVVCLLHSLKLFIDRSCCHRHSPGGSQCSEETDLEAVHDGYIPHVSSTQKMIDC